MHIIWANGPDHSDHLDQLDHLNHVLHLDHLDHVDHLDHLVDCPTQLTLMTWICQLSRRWGPFLWAYLIFVIFFYTGKIFGE